MSLPGDHMCTTPHDPLRFAVVETRTHVDIGDPEVRPTTDGKAPCPPKGFRFRVAVRGRPPSGAGSVTAQFPLPVAMSCRNQFPLPVP